MSNRQIQDWVILLSKDGEFVASVGNMLDIIYAYPYSPKHLVVCMDE